MEIPQAKTKADVITLDALVNWNLHSTWQQIHRATHYLIQENHLVDSVQDIYRKMNPTLASNEKNHNGVLFLITRQ